MKSVVFPQSELLALLIEANKQLEASFVLKVSAARSVKKPFVWEI